MNKKVMRVHPHMLIGTCLFLFIYHQKIRMSFIAFFTRTQKHTREYLEGGED